jgi:hypothetical protein
MGFGKQYAKGQAAAYDPVAAALNERLKGISGRMAGLPESVSGLYAGAEKAAGSVGSDISNIGTGFLGAVSGMGSSLPGLDTTELANAARSTARAGATGSMLGSVLGTQVGQARANSILEAQSRLAQEQQAAQDQLMQTQLEQGKVAADWMTPAAQRQQLRTGALSNKLVEEQIKQVPVANRAAWLANQAALGSIDTTILTNLAAMKKLGLSQKDMVKARKLYGGIKARGASGSSGSGNGSGAGNNPPATDLIT